MNLPCRRRHRHHREVHAVYEVPTKADMLPVLELTRIVIALADLKANDGPAYSRAKLTMAGLLGTDPEKVGAFLSYAGTEHPGVIDDVIVNHVNASELHESML